MGSEQKFTLTRHTDTIYQFIYVIFKKIVVYAIHDLVKQSKSFWEPFVCSCVSKFQDKTSQTKTKTSRKLS